MALFYRIPLDSSTFDLLLANLKAAEPNKTQWILYAITTDVSLAEFDVERFKEVLAAIERLLEDPNVTTDGTVARTCAYELYEIVKTASTRGNLPQIIDEASTLLTTTNKLGSEFWTYQWFPDDVLESIKTKGLSAAIDAIQDPNSSAEMLVVAFLRIRYQSLLTADLSLLLDEAMTRIALNSEQLHTLTQNRFGRQNSNDVFDDIGRLLATYLTKQNVQINNHGGSRGGSELDESWHNCVLDLLAAYRLRPNSSNVDRPTRGINQVLTATEGGFKSCIKALRKLGPHSSILITLPGFTVSVSGHPATELTREMILECMIHVYARDAEREINDRGFEQKVAREVYQLLGKFDANFDEALSAEEIKSMDDAPTAVDADGDTSFSRRELLEFFALQKQTNDEANYKNHPG